MFSFAASRPRRRPSLTPMIDVVFLLLIFFMLAARFGIDQAVPISMAGGAAGYSGPPRLVDVAPDGVALNGQPVALAALAAALRPLTQSRDDMIVLRPRAGADVQRVLDVADALRRAGFARLTVVE
jgi:biopolymer transport protein ExbD